MCTRTNGILIGCTRCHIHISTFNIQNIYLLMNPRKQKFIESLSKLPSSNRIEVYTNEEIEQRILSMSGPLPLDRAGRIRWQRLHQRFKIVPYQTTKLLYLKKKEGADHSRDKQGRIQGGGLGGP